MKGFVRNIEEIAVGNCDVGQVRYTVSWNRAAASPCWMACAQTSLRNSPS